VQVGGDVTATPFDVRAENGALLVALWLPGASGAAGSAAQHYVEWTCSGAAGAGWLLETLSTAYAGTVQQLLTTNQQGLESSTTGWAATGTGAVIARDAAGARTGSFGLKLDHSGAAGTNDIDARTPTGSSGFAVVAGAYFAVSAWVKDDATNHKTAELLISFYTSGSVLIGSAISLGTLTTTGSFQQLAGTAVAPSTAAYGTITWRIKSATNGTGVWYADDFSVTEAGLFAVLSVGGNTDTATIAGVETPGVDVPVLVGTTRTSPAGQAVAQT
jgi:hypothetical protein